MDWLPATPSSRSTSPLSMQYCTPSQQHIGSTASLPLTKENLSRVAYGQAEECEPSISMLARYYHDLSLPPLPMSPRRERKASSTTRSIRSDTVLASPRLSPFPYHNDSLFLPMAEKQQQQYIYHHQQMHRSISSQTSFNHLEQKRRSSANESHRKASPLSKTTPRRQTSAPPMDRATRSQWNHENNIKMRWPGAFRHWFARLFQGKKRTMTHSACSTKHQCLSEDSPVWYSQFAGNPSPPIKRPIVAA